MISILGFTTLFSFIGRAIDTPKQVFLLCQFPDRTKKTEQRPTSDYGTMTKAEDSHCARLKALDPKKKPWILIILPIQL